MTAPLALSCATGACDRSIVANGCVTGAAVSTSRNTTTARTSQPELGVTKLLDVQRHRLTQARQGLMLVVADLQRDLVPAGGQLKIERAVSLAEVHPRGRALGDHLVGSHAVGVDPETVGHRIAKRR